MQMEKIEKIEKIQIFPYAQYHFFRKNSGKKNNFFQVMNTYAHPGISRDLIVQGAGLSGFHTSEQHQGKLAVERTRHKYVGILIWWATKLKCPCDQI